MTTDSYIKGQYLQLIGAGFFNFVLVSVSRDFEVGSKSESTVSPMWG